MRYGKARPIWWVSTTDACYVLLGEDRLSQARARRERLKASRIRFPPSSCLNLRLLTDGWPVYFPALKGGVASLSEVLVGVRVPKPGLWEVWSLPPSVLGASAESTFPSKGKVEDSELGAHFFRERITQFESPMGPG